MEEEYDHLDGHVKNVLNVDDAYASAPAQLNGFKVSWSACKNKQKSLPKKVYEEGLNGEGGDIYAVVKKVRPPISNAAVENGNDNSNVNPEQTSSSSVEQVQTKRCDEEKWRSPKLVFATIVTVLALAGVLTGVVALIKLSTRTSPMETQKLATRINELEEQVERCSIRTDGLEDITNNNSARTDQLQEEMERNIARTVALKEYIESSVTNLNNSIQANDAMIEQLWNKTSELEATVFELHGWFILDGYRYRLTDEIQSWNKIRIFCQMEGGDLAAVGMRNESIGQIITETLLEKVSTIWIGLNDTLIEDHFVWVDGVNYTDGHPPWSLGEPNNAGDDGENCVEIYTETLKLNNIPCSEMRQGICETAL